MIVETLAVIGVPILVWWVASSIQSLRGRVDRQGRTILFLEYELMLTRQNRSSERPYDFVNVALELLEDRKIVGDPKASAKQLEDWGCGVAEIRAIAKRMNSGSGEEAKNRRGIMA